MSEIVSISIGIGIIIGFSSAVIVVALYRRVFG